MNIFIISSSSMDLQRVVSLQLVLIAALLMMIGMTEQSLSFVERVELKISKIQ
jgi:hypothetical protein